MNNSNILLYKFKLPVFRSVIWIVVGKTVREAIDWAEDKTSEKIAVEGEKNYIKAYTYAYTTESGKGRYMLFFRHSAKPGEIAHEVKHLINILFRWHGYKLSLTNDEMECYYLEDLVNRAHNALLKYKKMYKKHKPKRLDENTLNAILR